MKTPEVTAREALDLGRISRKHLDAYWLTALDRVTAALTERDKRADAIAEALRNIEKLTTDGVSRSIAAAALTAYEAQR